MAVETDEPNLLEQVIAYFKNLRQQEDWWDKLSEQEKAFVERSAKQIDEGKVTSNADVRKEINLTFN